MDDWAGKKAEDIMSSPVITVEARTPLREAAQTLSEHGISGAPVVDSLGNPIGVVSLFDIVSHLAGLDRPAGEPGGFYRQSFPSFSEGGEGWEEAEPRPLEETVAEEIMSPEIVNVAHDASLEDVARTLWARHIHRVFVWRRGRPVGVISTMDLLGASVGAPRVEGPAS
jgi:CBS domain-containing protein